MRIVRPGDPGYNKDRVICNARFDYRPWAIYYCLNADDVKQAISDARKHRKGVRIRSGGHQHEGMCSANDVLLIDVSGINKVHFVDKKQRVWIGSGAKLKDVYVALWCRGYYFPGGACGDVHVGGLTQGGGRGLGLRNYGLTSDSLIGVEIVTADGKILEIPRRLHPEDQRLLAALRGGGGGGNFGVVTRFCFRLHPMTHEYCDLAVTWGDDEVRGDGLDMLLRRWMSAFPRDEDKKLTTFMRVAVAPSGTDDRLLLSGRYLGSQFEAQRTLDRLILRGYPKPRRIKYEPVQPCTRKGALRLSGPERERLRERLGTHPGYQPGPGDLTSTCGGESIRHKISSGFVRPQVSPNLVPTLIKVIRGTNPILNQPVRQYVSLHCLGGTVSNIRVPSAYAFRDRDVLLQYQAW